jgi:hypothetical protein
VKRQNTFEIFLDPTNRYCCVPFSCLAARGGAFSFRMTSYSSEAVSIEREVNSPAIQHVAVHLLHKDLLSRDHKLLYPVADRSILACVHGDGCLAFVAVNGASDHFLSMKLTICVQDGIVVVFGSSEDSYDVPPCSQKMLAIVSSDGKLSSATQLTFRYLSSTVPTKTTGGTRHRGAPEIGRNLELNIMADLLTSSVTPSEIRDRVSETIDTFLWIPQLGAST